MMKVRPGTVTQRLRASGIKEEHLKEAVKTYEDLCDTYNLTPEQAISRIIYTYKGAEDNEAR